MQGIKEALGQSRDSDYAAGQGRFSGSGLPPPAQSNTASLRNSRVRDGGRSTKALGQHQKGLNHGCAHTANVQDGNIGETLTGGAGEGDSWS